MIPLVRIDNRLLHGQILETWAPRLGARAVVVADDEAAGSPLAQAAMTLALPPDLPATISPVAAVDWAALAARPDPVLVLLREVAALDQARRAGLTPALAPRVNLGNVHYAPGRRPVTPSVFLSGAELASVLDAARAGFEVEARAVPSDPPAGPGELEARYNASGRG
ncbi:PTS sugar transporter subunit IIB [Anaeromyxobacter paludicola]|uniref:PTS sugar transporter subunit IIBC n=1 Tax=Anaeromyxobacter paludicola TaxID=2918171 RepID=A0ABN6N8Q7_9BACT|nr:PTS sugar transporter subunit IIB [Anaeromyxobacter paludicola]BDG09597.1 PTS sugar transporter subunit IIBC [Anaeromyxobacter paludicola]